MVECEESTALDVELLRPWAVLIINDDVSTWGLVVEVLQRFFNKSLSEAHELTEQVDTEGQAVVGIFSKEVAELKISQVHDLARGRGYPLTATMEPT